MTTMPATKRKTGNHGLRAAVSADARRDYEEGGYTYRQLADKYNVSYSAVSQWGAEEDWKKKRAVKRRANNFLAVFSEQLQTQIDAAGEDWTDAVSTIKQLSDLVVTWQQHEARQLREKDEAERAKQEADKGSVRQFQVALEWILRWLHEHRPDIFKMQAQIVEDMVESYKQEQLK